jgi:hypothetical protein
MLLWTCRRACAKLKFLRSGEVEVLGTPILWPRRSVFYAHLPAASTSTSTDGQGMQMGFSFDTCNLFMLHTSLRCVQFGTVIKDIPVVLHSDRHHTNFPDTRSIATHNMRPSRRGVDCSIEVKAKKVTSNVDSLAVGGKTVYVKKLATQRPAESA